MNARYTHRIETRSDLDRLFLDLYRDVDRAHSRAELSELYSRAEYWVSLADSPAWRRKFDGGPRQPFPDERTHFRRVARKINSRARQIGLDAGFEESWRAK